VGSLLLLFPVAMLIGAEPSDVKVPWVNGPTLALQIDSSNPNPDPKKGFRITDVRPGCDVHIKPDDVVLAIDGKEVNGRPAARKILSSLQPGDEVEFLIQREFRTAINRPQKKRLKTIVKVRQYGEWAFSQMSRTDDEVRIGSAQFSLGEKLLTFDRSLAYIEPYFWVQESGEVQLYWRFCYHGRDWLFINSIEFRVRDRVIVVPIDAGGVKRSTTALGVTEEFSYPVPMNDLALLNSLGAVSEIPVSYVGEKGLRQFKVDGNKLQALWDGTAAAVWKAGNPE
jgi:hypothetical protein